LARSALHIKCPKCKENMQRMSVWNKKTKSIETLHWFYCFKCNNARELTYTLTSGGMKDV